MKSGTFIRLITASAFLSIAAASAAQNYASRDVLPIPEGPFSGVLADNVLDATPAPSGPVQAPIGAPNIVLFMADDVGFAMASTYGGPVPTPNFDRIAAIGQRYNNFHTTGICSPTRAALLTGRNHHNSGVGYLADLPNGFPGYGARILRSTASMAQVLTLNGYNTAMFGKHHNVPTSDRTEAGPFDSWPTGLGFEYFFGYVNGDTDQFEPNLYRGTQRVDPDEGQGEMLDERLADDLIRWLHNQQAGDPDKPFFAYLAPGSTHAPHQAPREYIDRFRGAFDQGWDEERNRIFRRQVQAGIIPADTILTQRPDDLPAWDELDPRLQEYAARSMEVAAAQLAFQDAQFGRVIDELQRMGEFDNTLFVVIGGDNGASGEAGNKGTVNEMRTMSFHDETVDWLHSQIDELGGPQTYPNYPVGWAWAMNTPFPWTKQYASMLGGIRNGAILAWPGRVAAPGSVCGQFGHVIDILPTALEAAHLPAPRTVLGTEQKPLDGESLLASLMDCQPDHPRTQYFEIGGKIGLYQNGWFLSGDDGRRPWEDIGPGGARPQITWTLADLTHDFAQSTDVAAQNPERLAAMQALWRTEAERNNVFPLDHRFARERGRALVQAETRRTYDFWGTDVSLPGSSPPRLYGRSFTLTAQLELDRATSSGVVLALGSHFGGWSLYLDHGRPAFTWSRSTNPAEIVSVVAQQALPDGARELVMRFNTTRPVGPATVTLTSGGTTYAVAELPVNVLAVAGGGETLDIGRDLGVGVTAYATHRGEIEGDIPHVAITFD